MSYVSVCKNVIASNNKKGWVNPDPAIRVSNSPHGKVVLRGHRIGIKDSTGRIVAEVVSTTDGSPVIGCGAKVAIITSHDVCEMDG